MSKAIDNTYEALYCRIHDCVVAELEGTASPEQSRELAKLVSSDETARQIYVAYMQELASLRQSYANQPMNLSDQETHKVLASLSRATDDRRFGQKFPLHWATLLAASLLTAVVANWLIVGRGQQAVKNATSAEVEPVDHSERPISEPLAGTAVATITRAVDATWEAGTFAPSDLSRLRIGQTLELEEGQVELLFDTGVEVILEGPTHFEIRSADSAYSRLGSISARVGEEASGFTIETPSARVIDLGTEFGASISETGETEVAVFKGIVDLAVDPLTKNSTGIALKRLNQGEALRVGRSGDFHRVFSISSDRFPMAAVNRRLYPNRKLLVADVRDNIRDPESQKFYKIVRSGLQEDAPAFVDRTHQWNGIDESGGIPPHLLGAEYVMPFNDDKQYRSSLEVTLFVAHPATLYVFFSDDVDVPDWLKSGFVDSGENIGLDEGPSRFKKRRSVNDGTGQSIDTIFSIWKREISAPSQVTLGGIALPNRKSKSGYNMYGIAAVPLD
ncbi:FecR domain-containing protein [Adhaeretor mobilis]|uniref:FecR protein n=1 Tax=Adhaeretor mobilis TaxID=1930276 RepID=A0A517MWE3_9BACT|nr:FecR domain-containing protein [Adhaeretor mobilis]QDS99200.1 FecR protein [Adhaeretor mobilis]